MKLDLPQDPFRDWPPVLTSARVPGLIRLRDVLLTLLMWAVLAFILWTELAIVVEAVRILRGRSDAEIDLALVDFYRRIRPLLLLVLVLTLVLGVATLVSRARRNRALAMRQPGPVDEGVLAARAGMAAGALAAAQAMKGMIVHRGDDGALSVEALLPAGPEGPTGMDG